MMKRNQKSGNTIFTIVAAAVVLFAIASCDTVEPPYRKSNTGIISERKVLIEDFTGHTCPNCPRAAHEADTMANYIYKGNVVVVALHVAQFADSFPSGPFTKNFKTDVGTAIDDFFKVSPTGLPKGMINRIDYPASQQKEYTSWGSEIGQLLAQDLQAKIYITTSYDSLTGSARTTVKSKFTNFLNGAYKLCVWYTEDSIIAPQLNYQAPTIIQNYVHMNVLRGSFNGTWGDLLKVNPNANDSITKQYTMQLRPNVVAKNSYVVAFIYNEITKEIIQVEKQKLTD